MTAEYKRSAALLAPTSGVTLDADNDAWGWNVGALFTVSPSTKIGVSYRSAIKHTLEGTLTGDGAAVTATGPAKADIELPETFIFSVTNTVNDRWEMLGDISWTGWSSVPTVDVMYADGRAGINGAGLAQRLDTDFRDTWRVALGANYKLNDAVKLKFGIAYDQTPVKGETTRLTSLPDNNRTWFTFGAQWKPAKDSTVDVGVAYLYLKDAKIDNNQTSAVALLNRGRVTGSYEDSCWILGAQYSMAF
jgi:long-chain fatty acid transport protein